MLNGKAGCTIHFILKIWCRCCYCGERCYSQFWSVRNSGDPGKMCLLTEIMQSKKKFRNPPKPRSFKNRPDTAQFVRCTRKVVQNVRSYGSASVGCDECSIGVCFDWRMGDFSTYKTKRASSMEIFDSCTIRNYVLTDYVLSASVKCVTLSQCDLILDQRFLCVQTEITC